MACPAAASLEPQLRRFGPRDAGTAQTVIVLLVILAVVALLVVGGLVIGLAFKLLWWALIGLAIGAPARLVLPGRQTIGLLATAGAGVAARSSAASSGTRSTSAGCSSS